MNKNGARGVVLYDISLQNIKNIKSVNDTSCHVMMMIIMYIRS